jgi:hypothetical protein
MSSEKVSAGAPTGAEVPTEVPERWSAQRKTELVVRLLRGEPVDAVARDSWVPAHELEDWRHVFLDGGTQSVKKWISNPINRTFFMTGSFRMWLCGVQSFNSRRNTRAANWSRSFHSD